MKYLRLYQTESEYNQAIGLDDENNADHTQPCLSVLYNNDTIKVDSIICNAVVSRTLLDENNTTIKIK